MIYKFQEDDLAAIAMVMDEPGFQVIEKAFKFNLLHYSNIKRMIGEPFSDGQEVGKAVMLEEILFFLNETKKEVREKVKDN